MNPLWGDIIDRSWEVLWKAISAFAARDAGAVGLCLGLKLLKIMASR